MICIHITAEQLTITNERLDQTVRVNRLEAYELSQRLQNALAEMERARLAEQKRTV
jgi:hypothetical protein